MLLTAPLSEPSRVHTAEGFVVSGDLKGQAERKTGIGQVLNLK